MRFFNRRGAFFENEWLSVVDRGLFRLVVLQLWNGRQLGSTARYKYKTAARRFLAVAVGEGRVEEGIARRRTQHRNRTSQSDPLHILYKHLLFAAVIKFCGAAVGVAGDPLSHFAC